MLASCPVEEAIDNEPPVPFDAETWCRMVELVNFLRLHQARPEVQDRVGEAIVRLRLRDAGGDAQSPGKQPPPNRLPVPRQGGF